MGSIRHCSSPTPHSSSPTPHPSSLTPHAPLLVLLLALATIPVSARGQDTYAVDRERLVREFVAGAGVKNPRVLDAMRATKRHEFVPPPLRKQAYYDMALPIGDQQTISSPFIVAYMTESLDPQPEDTVLEIGTGSGFQAAVLSPLVKDVYTIEIVEELGHTAERTLKRLNYTNVHVRVGDGFQGWPEHAPFDKIIVTCSPEKVPQPLVDQLREGGLMVIPVGERYQQTLYLMRKTEGKLVPTALNPTLFVPMTGIAESRRQVKPDPANPQVINGNFEEIQEGRNDVAPGWYYERQLQIVQDSAAPEGQRYALFDNDTLNRPAHLLQGLAIDGRKVPLIVLQCEVRTEDVQSPTTGDYCTLAITFYDENRKDLGTRTLGTFKGSHPWRHVQDRLRVPVGTREAIVRVGLFGSTGRASFDNIRIELGQ